MPLLLTAGCKHCHVHLNPWANVWEQDQSIGYYKTLQEMSQIEICKEIVNIVLSTTTKLEGMELSQDNVLDRQSQRLPTFQSKIEKFYKCQSKYSTNKILHLKETKILLQLFSLQKYAVFMFMTPRGLLNLILGNICDHLKCIQIQWSAASSVVS